MYFLANSNEGMPSRLYRSTEEIRRDIARVSDDICKINETLSPHNLLLEMIPKWEETEAEAWIPELEEVVGEAVDALSKLEELKETLDDLRKELYEVKCFMRSL